MGRLTPAPASTGRRIRRVQCESTAWARGVGLPGRGGPCARLVGGAGAEAVLHRVPPRRTQAAARGPGTGTPPTGAGGAASSNARIVT